MQLILSLSTVSCCHFWVIWFSSYIDYECISVGAPFGATEKSELSSEPTKRKIIGLQKKKKIDDDLVGSKLGSL